MPYVKSNETKIFYLLHKCIKNNGAAAIILIHGAGGNHLSMLSIFNYIKKTNGNKFNILTLDLPFHFKSKPEKNYTGTNLDNIALNKGIEYYAETIFESVSKLFGENTRFILIGHSMGGLISLKFAALHPHKTASVALIAACDSICIMNSFIKSLEKSFDKTIMLFLRDAYSTFDNNILKLAMEDIKRTPEQTVINDFKYVKYFNEDLEKDLAVINKHKLFFNLIYSKKDRIIRDTCVRELHEKIENSDINEIKSKSHIELLLSDSGLEKEIDKFLLT